MVQRCEEPRDVGQLLLASVPVQRLASRAGRVRDEKVPAEQLLGPEQMEALQVVDLVHEREEGQVPGRSDPFRLRMPPELPVEPQPLRVGDGRGNQGVAEAVEHRAHLPAAWRSAPSAADESGAAGDADERAAAGDRGAEPAPAPNHGSARERYSPRALHSEAWVPCSTTRPSRIT